jgi:hypothetical protein
LVGCNFPVGFGVGFDKLMEGVAIEILVLECKLKMKIKDFFKTGHFY